MCLIQAALANNQEIMLSDESLIAPGEVVGYNAVQITPRCTRGLGLGLEALASEDDAEKLADGLQAVDKNDTKEYPGGVIEFCRVGAFMVEPWGAKND